MEIEQLVNIISDAFDGNWTNENKGTIEELLDTQRLLVNGLSNVIALLIDKKIISLEEIEAYLQQGYVIEGGE